MEKLIEQTPIELAHDMQEVQRSIKHTEDHLKKAHISLTRLTKGTPEYNKVERYLRSLEARLQSLLSQKKKLKVRLKGHVVSSLLHPSALPAAAEELYRVFHTHGLSTESFVPKFELLSLHAFLEYKNLKKES